MEQRDYLNEWVDVDKIQIPPVKQRGFKDHIIIREPVEVIVWKEDDRTYKIYCKEDDETQEIDADKDGDSTLCLNL